MKISFDKMIEVSECDKALVGIARGKTEMLPIIHKYMERQIFAVAYSVLHDFSLCDDVVQETYVKIIDKASSYKPGSNAKAWILTVAHNTALDIRKHRYFEVADDIVESMSDDISDRFDESTMVLSMQVKEALDMLADEDRQIVTLKVYTGLKHSEIAAMLGISTEAAKKKYQRAMAQLKKQLG